MFPVAGCVFGAKAHFEDFFYLEIRREKFCWSRDFSTGFKRKEAAFLYS